ncbi:hypothetical protein EDC04DRAFT_3140154, partial [Pisolithus marmoratus]
SACLVSLVSIGLPLTSGLTQPLGLTRGFSLQSNKLSLHLQIFPLKAPWEVIEEDSQFYLLRVHTANTRPKEDKVYAYYGEPGEKWKVIHHPLRRGYTILSPDESLAWYLSNPEYFTQVLQVIIIITHYSNLCFRLNSSPYHSWLAKGTTLIWSR